MPGGSVRRTVRHRAQVAWVQPGEGARWKGPLREGEAAPAVTVPALAFDAQVCAPHACTVSGEEAASTWERVLPNNPFWRVGAARSS